MAKKKAPAEVAPDAPEKKEQYQVIHLKYRPKTFAEVVGQRAVVRQLQGDIKDNRVGTAYLFTGPRGVGKTSMARIFAKALNCVNGPTPDPCGVCTHCVGIAHDSDLDVIEVDAATYTKKEETIELLEGIDRVTFHARHKVYIIDEVHMFSTQSFNVLLKRLEEPPPGVVFILATTNPEKIPETVISRCRRLEFDRMDNTDIVNRLSEIAEREKVSFAEGEKEKILEAIALSSEGGMRDSQVALDQLISMSEDGSLSLESARQLLGIVESDLLADLLAGLVERDTTKCLLLVQSLVDKGRDLQRFIKTFTSYLRDGMMVKAKAPDDLLKVCRADPEPLRALVAKISMPEIMNYMQMFLDLEERMRGAAPARFLLEFTLIKLTAINPRFVLDAIDSKELAHADTRAASAPAKDTGNPVSNVQQRSIPASKFDEPKPTLKPGPVASLSRGSAAPELTLHDSAVDAVEDLPDITVDEPKTEYPKPEMVTTPPSAPSENWLNDMKAVLGEKGGNFAVLRSAQITLNEETGIVEFALPSHEKFIADAFSRPENLQMLRSLVSKMLGEGCHPKVTLDQVIAVEDASPSEDDPEEDNAIDAYRKNPEVFHSEMEQQAVASKEKSTYLEALKLFPDFREAVELIRKHCGADPVLFNGERI